MPYKDKEKAKQYNTEYKRNWYKRNRKRWFEYLKRWQSENAEKTREYSQKYYWANREKEIIRVMEGNKRRYRKLRLEAIEYYGNECVCCGENRIQFLAIDHIEGGGRKHREYIKKEGKSRSIYEWLKKNNYPKGFRILCHNCNMSKGFYGYCPHQVEKGELSEKDLIEIEIKLTIERKKCGQKNNSKKEKHTI